MMQLRLRAATVDDAPALGLVTVSASMATFLGRVPEESIDFGWTPEASAQGWREVVATLALQELFTVAEVDRRVVGFVWAGTSTASVEFPWSVRGLYVLPTAQRQSIGRALLRHAVSRLASEAGATTLLIGCVRENPSCGFYRHLGGVEVFRRPQRVDRFETEEIFFA
jgi:GNAT superfamily N-acetyltransferase